VGKGVRCYGWAVGHGWGLHGAHGAWGHSIET